MNQVVVQNKPLTTIFEIATVLATMLAIKAVADYFQLTGAGPLGIWSGILLATLWLRSHHKSWQDLGLFFPKGWRSWLVNLGITLVIVVFVFLLMGLVLDPLLNHLGLEKPDDAADRFAFFLGKPGLFILYLVTVVWIGAALGEEMLMRGYLLNRLAELMGQSKLAWTLALLIHAAIFGALHLYQGIPGMVSAGVIALIFGLVYLLNKRYLFPVILAHGLINTISLTAYYLSDGVPN